MPSTVAQVKNLRYVRVFWLRSDSVVWWWMPHSDRSKVFEGICVRFYCFLCYSFRSDARESRQLDTNIMVFL